MKFLLKPIYQKMMKSLSPIMRMKISYFRIYKKWPNLKNPQTFNEKVLKRIAYEKNPIFAELADKYKVRKFISKRIGEDVLIPLILDTKDPIDLLQVKDWSGTVIKPNHAAGLIEIFDENPTDDQKNKVIEEAKQWLNLDFSKIFDEWHYSLIEPRLLMEKKITNKNEIPRDYKFHCFRQKDGSINYVMQLVDGRFGNESRAYYLNSLDNCIWHHGDGNHNLSDEEKNHLNKVFDFHNLIMGDNFSYIRIDWYLINKTIYFGELTFTPGAGRANEFGGKLEKIMSDWWIN